MTCEHEWDIAETYVTAFKMKRMGVFVCQKCMSYKEEELKFIKEDSLKEGKKK